MAAINDQSECARVLLVRGCDASIVNNSHQNAYQVAVISGNMALAEMIASHRSEHVLPYRDRPRFNPARRPPSDSGNASTLTRRGSGATNGSASEYHRGGGHSSPQTLNNNNTSTGIFSDDEGGPGGEGEDEDELEDEEFEDEEGEEDDETNLKSSEESNSTVDNSTFTPGITVKAVSDYNSGDPSHLQLRRNDLVLLIPSSHSPPTIASQKLLLGRRVTDGEEGFFPACCIEKIRRRHQRRRSSAQNGTEGGSSEGGAVGGSRVEGRRDLKLKSGGGAVQSATLPSRGRRGARKCLLDKVKVLKF